MKTSVAGGLAAAALVLVSACSTQPVQPPDQNPTLNLGNTEPVMPFDHPPLGTGGGGGSGGGGGAGGGSANGPLSGGTQRLSVKQLRNSLPVILGGETWKIGAANGFDTRSITLGEPDYISIVDENLEPSPLYLKFMTDMARDACNRAMLADVAQPTMASRSIEKFVGLTDTVATNAAGVDANLRYLRLAFHGIKVAPTDELPISSLRKLFDDAVKAAKGTGTLTQAHVTEGWRTVCVALLTAPEYHLY
jgi:hypothetical protein